MPRCLTFLFPHAARRGSPPAPAAAIDRSSSESERARRMPCCHWVLSVAAASSSSSRTPSWLLRLHAKGGLSFPSHLHIDDLLYGQSQPPPLLTVPPPPPSDTPHDPPPRPPRNPSRPNPNPPPPLSGVISDLFAVPSAPRSTRPAVKPFRKQSRPRPRPDGKSSHKDDKDKAKARKRRRADRAAAAADDEGERRSRTEVTVIDTSTDGWKAAKLLLRRGAVWKVRDKKDARISGPEDLGKGKRRAGLVAKIQRDKEKEKDAALALPGNIRASSGDAMKESDDSIQMLKRPRCSDPVPEGQSAEILLLQSASTLSQP